MTTPTPENQPAPPEKREGETPIPKPGSQPLPLALFSFEKRVCVHCKWAGPYGSSRAEVFVCPSCQKFSPMIHCVPSYDEELAATTARLEALKQDVDAGDHISGSFFMALKLANLQAIDVQNPGRHVADIIRERDDLRTRLEAAEKERDEMRAIKEPPKTPRLDALFVSLLEVAPSQLDDDEGHYTAIIKDAQRELDMLRLHVEGLEVIAHTQHLSQEYKALNEKVYTLRAIAKKATAERDDATAKLGTVRKSLEQCADELQAVADIFMLYCQKHKNKKTPEGDAKAQTNLELSHRAAAILYIARNALDATK